MMRLIHAFFLILATAAVSAAQPPSAGQGGFVPIDQLPAPESFPAAPLVIAAYAFAWLAVARLRLLGLAAAEPSGERAARGDRPVGTWRPAVNFSEMTSAHFIFIPAVLLIGIVIGWVLGSRAAADAYQAELKRREERKARQ